MATAATPEPGSGDESTRPRDGGGIRLLVLDVDGTVTNSRHEVDAATVAAIGRARAAGIGVMIATGRRYRDVLPVADRLGIGGAIVTASGALVKRREDHATLFKAAFAPGTLRSLLDVVVAHGRDPILYTDSFAAGFDFHCGRLPPAGEARGGVEEYLERNRHVARLAPDIDRSPPDGVFAGFAMGPRDAMLELERALHDACPGRLALHVIKSPRYREWMCELAPAGVTKWSGVLPVAAAWGIAAAEICAVGDDVNDLPMIRGAGLGIAMGNAREEVRAAADRVVGDNEGRGIAEVAEIVIEGAGAAS